MKHEQPIETRAREQFKTANPEVKQVLVKIFGEELFENKIPTHLHTYEDCCEFLGEKPLDMDALRAAGATEFGIAAMINETIVKAINYGERPIDMLDTKQQKWMPYLKADTAASGFAFNGTRYPYSTANAGYASRFCSVDAARAEFYGERFTKYIIQLLTA